MSDDLRTLLQEHPEWLRVLAAYATLEPETIEAPPAEPLAAEDEEQEPTARGGYWFPRLSQVDGVPDEQLAPLHGRLIAHGLLQFNLGGRDTGVRYRVTGEARKLAIEFHHSAAPIETAEADHTDGIESSEASPSTVDSLAA